MAHLVLIKPLAGALNTTGIAAAITGAVAPTVGAFYGTLTNVSGWWLLLVASGCFISGIILRVIAQLVLGRLRDA